MKYTEKLDLWDLIKSDENAYNSNTAFSTELRKWNPDAQLTMRSCIPLEAEELLTLRSLLCKAVTRMHELVHDEEKA